MVEETRRRLLQERLTDTVARLSSLGLVVSSTPAMRKRPPTRKRPREPREDVDDALHGLVCAMPWSDDVAVDGEEDEA
jgi:hypothetical protein